MQSKVINLLKTKEGIVMGLGMDMERDELLEDRAAFTAGG